MFLKKISFLIFTSILFVSANLFAQDANDNEDASMQTNDALEQAIASHAAITDPAHISAYIDGLVYAYMEKDKLPGVTLSIVKDGAILYEKGYGIKDLSSDNAVSPTETLFRVGSVSKTFIWTALMQLQERELLDINDPVNNYLPAELAFNNNGFNQPILIRHLMTHSLGLEDSFAGHLFKNKVEDVLPLEEYLARYRPAQVREAGLSTSYSNYGSAVAGLIVARVSGEPDFQSYVDKYITGPLGMNNSTFREPTEGRNDLPAPMSPDLVANLASGIVREAGTWKIDDYEFIGSLAPAGAFSATARDMALYMNAHLGHTQPDGTNIVSPDTIATIRTTLFSNAEDVNGFAHGFIESSVPGDYFAYGHGGATLNFMTNMILVPELDLGIFVSTNRGNGRDFVVTLPNLIIEHLFPRATPNRPSPSDDFVTRGGKYVGSYLYDRRSYTMIEKLASMPDGFMHVGMTKDGYLLLTSGSTTSRWVEIGRNTFGEVDSARTIAFGEDNDGNITKLYPDSGIAAATKVGFFRSPTWFSMIFSLALLAGFGSATGAWLRRNRQITESLNEAVSSRLVALQGFLGLAFIVLFALFVVNVSEAGNNIVYHFPPTILVFTLWAAIFVGVVNVFSLPSLYIIWRDGNWPIWRRIRHTLAVLIYFALTATLLDWNMIGFNYF